jgi:hypothetical protein
VTITLTFDRRINWRPGYRVSRLHDGLRAVRVWWLFGAIAFYNRDDHDLLAHNRGWVR